MEPSVAIPSTAEIFLTESCSTNSQSHKEHESAAECRIVNLQLLSKHIEEVTQHVIQCLPCQGMAKSPDAVTITEEKDHDGLASVMSYKFNGCGQQITFAISIKTIGLTGRAQWTNNLAAVWGQMAVGGGFNSLEELMSALGVPVMTKSSFIYTERIIGKWWWIILEESILTAGKEEKQIAMQKKNSYHGEFQLSLMGDGANTHISIHIILCLELVSFSAKKLRSFWMLAHGSMC